MLLLTSVQARSPIPRGLSIGPSLTFARADAPVLDVGGDGAECQGASGVSRAWGRRGHTPVVTVTGSINNRVSLAALIAINPRAPAPADLPRAQEPPALR